MSSSDAVGLPSSWHRATLGEVAAWGSGGTPKATNSAYYGGEIPWAVIGDLGDGVVRATAKTITQRGLEESSAKIVEPGTLLLAMYGSIGKLGIAGMRMATNQAIAFAVPCEAAIDRGYLFWYLLSQRSKLATAGKGATQANISQTVLKSWPVPLAPLAEQRRIVEAIETHVSHLDAGAEALERAGRNIERMRAAVLKAAVEGKLVPQDPSDEPAEELLARVLGDREREPTTNGELPLGWTWARASDVGDVITGSTPSTKREDYWGSGFPFVTPSDLQPGGRVATAARHLTQDGVEAARPLPATSVLVTCIGATIGKSSVNVVPCATNQQINALVPRSGIDGRYLGLVAASPGFQDQIHANASSTTMPILNKGRFSKLLVPVPPTNEQVKIIHEADRQLSVLEAMENLIGSTFGRVDALRRSLLADAFSGHLVPQDPSDEPASVLLDRIRCERERASG